jgi:hypothetical protein
MLSKRLANLWCAVVGQSVSELETQNAEALLDFEREALHQKVQQYNRGLAGHAALCERLKVEVVRLERERALLQPKLQARLSAGDRAGAGRHALRLQQIASELQTNTQQLEESEAMYRELVRSREVAMRAAHDKLNQLRGSITALRAQQALADLSEMAAGMHGSIGLSDADVERLRQRVDDKRHQAAGRVRVARDCIDTSAVDATQAEQEALAELALREYEAHSTVQGQDAT